jgi:cysteine desulfuration protein SufE
MRTINDVKEYLEEIQESFDFTADKEEKMEIIIEMGSELEDFPESEVKAENKVQGCVSNVYIYTETNEEGGIKFYASSSSLIVKGYLTILTKSLNGINSSDLKEAEKVLEEFVIKNDLNKSIVPSRANVIGNIFALMKKQANELN